MLQKWVRSIRDFILPPVCVNCGKVGVLLCQDCHRTIHWIQGQLCSRCGRQKSKGGNYCGLCQDMILHQVRAALSYKEPIKSIIHKMKYNKMFGLAELLADLMLEAWPQWQTDFDMILPVPLHEDRLRVRGYNQSDYLANHLGKGVNLPVNKTALERVRHTMPQVGLNRLERQDNVQGAFFADATAVSGSSVLLIDDVYTTGATMSAAAAALLAVGATHVSAYCVARPA